MWKNLNCKLLFFYPPLIPLQRTAFSTGGSSTSDREREADISLYCSYTLPVSVLFSLPVCFSLTFLPLPHSLSFKSKLVHWSSYPGLTAANIIKNFRGYQHRELLSYPEPFNVQVLHRVWYVIPFFGEVTWNIQELMTVLHRGSTILYILKLIIPNIAFAQLVTSIALKKHNLHFEVKYRLLSIKRKRWELPVATKHLNPQG